MAKKNKKKNKSSKITKEPETKLTNRIKSESILIKRLKNRKIPKVDDGVKDNILSNEDLKAFYRTAHVSEFIHMETAGRKHKSNTNRIKFEFSDMMLSQYRIGVDDRGENDIIRKLTYAEMTKKSFINNINNTLRYTNYFIEYFDDDDEIMAAYFYMMFQIMLSSIELDPSSFIETLYAAFSTDTIIEKVIHMVEYNVDSSMIKPTDRVYDESIQLTLEHLKAIMCVSCLHKFVIPIVSHYCVVKSGLLAKAKYTDKDLYYMVFNSFVGVFDKAYGICLYDKLYHTATTRVTKTETQESPMWNRRYRQGVTPASYTNHLMREFLINISQKIIFSKSAIIFIHVCFDRAIKNELLQTDKFEFTDMRMDASDSVDETISRFDRWQMDRAFHSEKDRIRASVSVRDILDRLGLEFGIDFKRMRSNKTKDVEYTRLLRDEHNYYRKNMPSPLSDTQLFIIQLYFSSKVENTEDIEMMEYGELIDLIMIMKRDFMSRNFPYLQMFITGNLQSTTMRAPNIRKVETSFKNHPCYEDWKKEYQDPDDLINMNKLLGELKVIQICPIIGVEYDFVEYRDQLIRPVDVGVTDEFMRFLISL